MMVEFWLIAIFILVIPVVSALALSYFSDGFTKIPWEKK